MRKLWSKPHFRVWLAIVGTATLVLAAAYAMVQQSTRLSANDLPDVTAQQIKQQLVKGTAPEDIIKATKINLRSDVSGFAIITDDEHHVLASNASLDNHTPLPPSGTFAYTRTNGLDGFTWEPETDVRLATN